MVLVVQPNSMLVHAKHNYIGYSTLNIVRTYACAVSALSTVHDGHVESFNLNHSL